MEIKQEYIKIIQKNALFRNISEQDLLKSLDFLHAHIKEYKKEEYLMHLGDVVEEAGIVLDGTVEGSFISETYHKINMNHFKPGRTFAEALSAIPIRHSPIQLCALTDCTILWLNIRVVLSDELFTQYYQQQLAMNMIRQLASQTVFSNLKLRIASQNSLRDRILIYLHSLTPDANGYVHIPFTKTALAEFLGVNRSALSREMGRMMDEGIIEEAQRSLIRIIRP